MNEIDSLFINAGEVKLESEYYKSKAEDTLAVLITHPHPQFGGSMHNNVVSSVFKTLIENDVSCLRFNFRSVGKSTGKHSNGRGELKDVEACIDFLGEQKNHERILICGYSYGAAIGCSAVNYSDKIIGYIAISFPWDFMGLKYKKKSNSDKIKLFIQGNSDDIANYERFYDHYEDYYDPKKEIIIDGADHFYNGYEAEISKEVRNFIESL